MTQSVNGRRTKKMKFEWKKAESTVSPELIDDKSAPGKTYIRKNVESYQNADNVTMYKYDELLIDSYDYAEYEEQSKIELLGKQISDLELIVLSGYST